MSSEHTFRPTPTMLADVLCHQWLCDLVNMRNIQLEHDREEARLTHLRKFVEAIDDNYMVQVKMVEDDVLDVDIMSYDTSKLRHFQDVSDWVEGYFGDEFCVIFTIWEHKTIIKATARKRDQDP